MASKFGEQVRANNEKVKRRQLAIFRSSTQRVMEIASVPEAQGGRMPIDTGFLTNSVLASTSGMPGSAGQPVALVLLQVQLGASVFVGWTAAYAMRMEYGFMGQDSLGREYSQSGKAFLRGALQQWTNIVNDATIEARKAIP
ncbi:hypothetical protein [Luteimonas fraxinea]|uniref:HK97 gp10 family phage protein n=1 Tax=Luteimonas fraxinea TaxID=2901869 RepID=A0ABS8UAX2_9GAMM|nr:hypothetical protein [Luteimonas fraxinea]MCD9096194.1 hypothetical protein [Luteimonas fraxinea]